MASVTNRVTKEYRQSVNTPDFSPAQWIINSAAADALFAAGILSRHWNIAGDVVSEMSPAEKAVVDAAALDASRDATAAEIDGLENIVRSIIKLLVSELNVLRAQHALADRTLPQARAAIRSDLGS